MHPAQAQSAMWKSRVRKHQVLEQFRASDKGETDRRKDIHTYIQTDRSQDSQDSQDRSIVNEADGQIVS